MRSIYLLSVLFLLAAASCNTTPEAAEKKVTVTEQPKEAPSSNLGTQGTNDLMAMMSAYYELKEALVATNAVKADAAASRVLSAAETLHQTVSRDSAHQTIQNYIDTVMNASEAVVNVKDETCEKKRAHFEKVSDAIYGIAKAAALKNGGIYHQYCPMAFNDKGAFWLSNESEIRNPYFGKKMLECGEVKDSL